METIDIHSADDDLDSNGRTIYMSPNKKHVVPNYIMALDPQGHFIYIYIYCLQPNFQYTKNNQRIMHLCLFFFFLLVYSKH